jgi:hypothetical protein
VPSLNDPDNKLTGYSVLATNGTLSVTAATLTVTADNQTRLYGQPNPAWTVTCSGFVNGENVSIVTGALFGATSAQLTSPVGSYPITVSGLTAPNYDLQYRAGTLTVLPAPLVVTALDASRAYGLTNPPFGASFSGFANGENSNVLTGTLLIGSPAQTNSAVGTYPIVPSGLAATNYALLYTNGTLTVTPNALLVKADDQTRTYGATNRLLTGLLTGLANGDRITASYSTLAGTNSFVGSYPIVPSLSDPDSKLTNYSLTISNGTLTVTTAALLATAYNQSKTYGDTNPALAGGLTGLMSGDNITASFLTSAEVHSGVGSYPITIGLSDPAGRLTNYAVTTNAGSLTVGPALLTVRADNQSRSYGSNDPPFTAAITGFVLGETVAVVAGAPNLTTAASLTSGVGPYPIVAASGTLNAANYAFSFVAGTLTITPVPLTITAQNASRSYGQPNPAFSAAFNGFVNGEGAGVLGGTLVFSTLAQSNSAVGPYPIVPSGLTATNYTLSYSNGTLNVTAYTLVVSADSLSRTYGATNPPLTGSLSGLANGDRITPSYFTLAGTNSPVGRYDIVPRLDDPDGKLPNYSLVSSNGTLTILSAPLLAAADDKLKAYGDANPPLTGSLTGLMNHDNISMSCFTTANAASGVSSYPIGIALTDPDGRLANYTVTTNAPILVVGPALITVRADSQSRTYGSVNPTFTATMAGFVLDDTASVVAGTPSLTTTASQGSGVGPYPIVAGRGSLSATNYVFDYVAGTLTITPAALTATADNQTRFYGHTNPLLTVGCSGFANGEDSTIVSGTLLGSTSVGIASPVGDYAITVSGLSAPNYTLQYRPGVLSVVPTSLLVAAQDASRAYGQTNPPFSATLSGFVNGEDSNVLSGRLAFTTPAQSNSPVGLYPILPGGLTATNYTIDYSNATLTITPYALVVRADNQNRPYGAANPILTGTLSGVLPGDAITASYSTTAISNTPVGSYAILPVLSDPNQRLTNYSVTSSNGTLTVTPAPLLASADNQYRPYGVTNPPLTVTLTGVVAGDQISAAGSTAATPASPVGGYPISVALADPGYRLTNYTVTTNSGTLAVYHARLFIKPDDQTRVYGTDNPPLTCTLSGRQNNDNLSGICWTTAGPASPVGAYGIFAYLDDPDSKVGNYILDFESGTLTVTSACSVVLLASSLNPAVPGTNVTLTATVSPAYPATGTPDGAVEFFTNGVAFSAPVALDSGVARISLVALPSGYHTVTAAYLGNGDFLSSTNSLVQVVRQLPVTLSIRKDGSGSVTVSFQGAQAATWIIEASTNAAVPGSWFGVSTNTLGSDGLLTITNSSGAQPRLFFRARTQ